MGSRARDRLRGLGIAAIEGGVLEIVAKDQRGLEDPAAEGRIKLREAPVGLREPFLEELDILGPKAHARTPGLQLNFRHAIQLHLRGDAQVRAQVSEVVPVADGGEIHRRA